MQNSHSDSFFKNLINFFRFFKKGLASNAQTNPDIEKHQLVSNDAKNLMGGKNLSFNIFKNLSTRHVVEYLGCPGSWVSSTGV